MSKYRSKIIKIIHLILSIDYSSEDSIMGGIEESAEERHAHAPPPSLVPRLHVVLANHLSHINPYIPDYKQEDFKQGQ